MSKRQAFFFFLLIFISCSEGDKRPLSLLPDFGPAIPLKESRSPARGPLHDTGPVFSQETHAKPAVQRKKRNQKAAVTAIAASPEPFGSRPDSLIIERLNYIRSHRIDLDLNEPVSKDFLLSRGEIPSSPVLITLGSETVLSVNFDNDILDYTDRFYTNGIKIDLIAPSLRLNPIGKLMIPYRRSGKNYYGLTVVQNMYTPSTTKIGGILYGDRPYAAYLYLGSFRITLDQVHHYKQTSELDIGIIGPKSYGEWVQRSFHNAVPTNNEPLGWEYQIQNDLVFNYSAKFEKGIWNRKNADLILTSSGEIGTLYTNLGGGFHFRTGWLNPWFANPGVAKKEALQKAGLRKFQFVFFMKGSGKFVGYDATLQGGLLNRSSVYTLPAGEISRAVFQCSGGISLSYNGFRVDMEQFLLSPDFHQGWWHKWVHLSLAVCL
jgi:lipid A 3-O-deacylase